MGPDEIAAGLLDIARNAKADRDRVAAWRELADRGWGKAPSYVAVDGLDPLELDGLAQEIARLEDEVKQRRQRKAATASGSPEVSDTAGSPSLEPLDVAVGQ